FFRIGWMLGEIVGKSLIHKRFNDSFDLAVTELGLCLTLELRFRNLDANNRHQTFAHIFSLKIFVIFLELPTVYSVAVDGTCKRGFKTDQMGTTLHCVDIVGERSEEHTSELQSPCNLVCR